MDARRIIVLFALAKEAFAEADSTGSPYDSPASVRRGNSSMKTVTIISILCIAGTLSGLCGEAKAISLNHAGKTIDGLVARKLEALGIAPNPPASDEVFLRRTWLVIGGRIPTIDESTRFFQSAEPDKRAKLIDSLLDSEAYVSNFFNYWADILRINSGLNQGRPTAEDAYRLWLKEALRTNLPYDEMVRRMITAVGPWWEDGAVGYFIRDRGMPLDAMSNTVRVFLGTRLECAQCHDHPFDKWTQMDFYKMAAFTYGIDSRLPPQLRGNHLHFFDWYYKTRSAEQRKAAGREDFPGIKTKAQFANFRNGPNYPKALRRLGMSENEFDSAAQRGIEAWEAQVARYWRMRPVIDALYRPVLYTAAIEQEKELKLPHDYQYSDASPGDSVEPETIFGPKPGSGESNASDPAKVKVFANWMTSPENPRFARVIANRLWKQVFGAGIFEPIDELTDHTHVSNPELMDFLEALILELDFDLKAYLRVLLNTESWQRESSNTELVPDAPFHFAGPAFRRMSAEQIWDSAVGLIVRDVDELRPLLRNQLGRIENHRRILTALESHEPDEFIEMVERLAGEFQENNRLQEELRKEIVTARAQKNQDEYLRLRQAQRMSNRRLSHKIAEIGWGREGAASSLRSDSMEIPKLSMVVPVEISREQGLPTPPLPTIPPPPAHLEGAEIGTWKSMMVKAQRTYRNSTLQLARASELATPAPRGHFLRDFGQSDRIEIENAVRAASVPQALNLMNGEFTATLANPFSTLGSSLDGADSHEERIRLIFQAMFSRQPDQGELDLALDELQRDEDKGMESLIWSLLNTRQFLFIR